MEGWWRVSKLCNNSYQSMKEVYVSFSSSEKEQEEGKERHLEVGSEGRKKGTREGEREKGRREGERGRREVEREEERREGEREGEREEGRREGKRREGEGKGREKKGGKVSNI